MTKKKHKKKKKISHWNFEEKYLLKKDSFIALNTKNFIKIQEVAESEKTWKIIFEKKRWGALAGACFWTSQPISIYEEELKIGFCSVQ